MVPSRPSSIADDWQEIDGAASVRSLSSHDDDDDDHVVDVEKPLVEPPTVIEDQRPSSGSSEDVPVEFPPAWSPFDDVQYRVSELDLNEAHAPQTPMERQDTASPSRSIESQNIEEQSIEEQSRTAILPNTSISSDEPWRTETSYEQRLSDPIFFHDALSSAIEALTSATQLIKDLSTKFSVSIPLPVTRVHVCLSDLDAQAGQLRPILEAYAGHWDRHSHAMAASEIPVNADLFQWIGELSNQLRVIQQAMTDNSIHLPTARIREKASSKQPGSPERCTLDALTRLSACIEPLKTLHQTMADFLPILKVDFAAFQTKHMTFPTSDTEARGRRKPPHPAISRIRAELYGVKDQIGKIRKFLLELFQAVSVAMVPDGASEAIDTLNTTFDIITIILTNHASEWIDSDLDAGREGLLSFHSFVNLDADVLYDIASHLRQFYDELYIDENDVDIKGNVTTDMILDHQVTMLTAGRKLPELLSMMEFLGSMLRPGAD